MGSPRERGSEFQNYQSKEWWQTKKNRLGIHLGFGAEFWSLCLAADNWLSLTANKLILSLAKASFTKQLFNSTKMITTIIM